MTQPIKLVELRADQHARWDAYVEQAPSATFFHRAGWAIVLEKAFGHTVHYIYAERGGKIVGILPLAEVQSFLFGHSLASTPFSVYGGAVADDDEVKAALVKEACSRAEQLQVDYLELRHINREQENWPCKDLYFHFRKTISDDPDENLKAIPRKQRAVVRKAIALELDATIDTDIERFYTAYSTSVRNLGTPVFAKKYFRLLYEVFADNCDIMVISKDGQLIAAVMSFYFRDEVLPYYGGGGDLARQYKGNDFMYWALMNHAAERGARLFDYGRSKQGTGAFSFKKNWGFEPQPLHYEYYLVKADEVPDVNPLNPKYQLMINCWKKLPLGVSQFIGPMVSKYLG